MLINFCIEHDTRLVNTFFQKRVEQLVTYREPGTDQITEPKRGAREQLNYIVISNRWNIYIYIY